MHIQLQADSNAFDEHSRKVGDLMGELHSRSFHSYYAERGWKPSVNLYEGPEAFVVCFDVAGMKAEQIDVRAEDCKLIIRGDRPMPQSKESPGPQSVHLMEIDSGSFTRKVEIPSNVDEGKIDATYRDGFLWVVLPKRKA